MSKHPDEGSRWDRPQGEGPGILDELRRRRVIRTAIAYVGAAVVLLEGTDMVLDALGLDRAVFRVLVIAAIAGLPIAVVLGWLYDLTRGGIRRTGPGGGDRLVVRFRPAVVLPGLGLLLLVAVGGAVLWLERASPGPVESPGAAFVVAVLPFSVSGEELEVLEHGIIDLLATNLDQVGALRVVDPRTVLARWRDAGGKGPLPLQEAMELAQKTGAESILTGSAVAVGAQVRLTADLYTIEGTRLATAHVDGPRTQVLTLVDDLSVRLLREIWRSDAPLPRLDIGAITSNSLPAVRAFLRGESLYRASDWTGALAAFQEATAADPEFSLAHYRISSTAGWLGDTGLEQRSIAAALEGMERLPQREQTLLRVQALVSAGDRGAAVDSLAAYVERYPEDPEGWFRLADQRYHLETEQTAPRLALSIQDLWMFDTVLELDPTYLPGVIHPLDLSFQLSDTAAIERYRGYLTDQAPAAPAGLYRLASQALRGRGEGPDDLARAIEAAVRSQNERRDLAWQAGRAVLNPLLRQAALLPTGDQRAVVRELQSRLGEEGRRGAGLRATYVLMLTSGDVDGALRMLADRSVRSRVPASVRRQLAMLPLLGGAADPADADLPDELAPDGGAQVALALLGAVDRRDPERLRRALSAARRLDAGPRREMLLGFGEGFLGALTGEPTTGLRQVESALSRVPFTAESEVEALWFRWLQHAVTHPAAQRSALPLLERPWPGSTYYEPLRIRLAQQVLPFGPGADQPIPGGQ